MAWLTERNWRMLAACPSIDPDLFFPVSSAAKPLEQVAEARAVCACCLVRRQCLASRSGLGRRTASGAA